MKRLGFFTVVALCLLWAGTAFGGGWQVSLADHPNLPSKFLAVDKESQKFFIYGRKSPLRVLSSFTCSTGQSDGDKQVEGDKRTPEGVYFVEGRMRRELDWELYGNLAYPLNYPNPIDRLKGKTGYGIWIHGRGRQLVPKDTQGCVALNTPDLAGIGSDMQTGLPVVISQELGDGKLSEQAVRDMDEAVGRVHQWVEAWEQGSEDFFSFYDKKGFARTVGKSFNSFRNHKRGIFNTQPWIRVMAHDVRAVPGPDYVVTYFRQYYRTKSIVSEGIKRLYWMRGEDGKLRIVGREWDRTPRTLDKEYLAYSEKEIAPLVEAWRIAWELGDLKAYMAHYAPDAAQGKRQGTEAIREHKESLWKAAPPKNVAFLEPRYSIVPEGIQLTFGQSYVADNGYEDHGIKTMLLAPAKTGWKILREDWRPL